MWRKSGCIVAVIVSAMVVCRTILSGFGGLFFQVQVFAQEETAEAKSNGQTVVGTAGDAIPITATPGDGMMAEKVSAPADLTALEISFGGIHDVIRITPGKSVGAYVKDGQSRVEEFRYQLDELEWCMAEPEGFELSFAEPGIHSLTVYARDTAGNEREITKRIVVDETPIIRVTLPTDTELIVLSRPLQGGVNIFSADWEIVNQSNVPICARIAEYSVVSDFSGNYGSSYLNLKVEHSGSQQDISLGFSGRKDIFQFVLGQAEYTQANEYIQSGEAARAVCSYWGFADKELNDYLRYHKAAFHMAFVFEPVMLE